MDAQSSTSLTYSAKNGARCHGSCCFRAEPAAECSERYAHGGGAAARASRQCSGATTSASRSTRSASGAAGAFSRSPTSSGWTVLSACSTAEEHRDWMSAPAKPSVLSARKSSVAAGGAEGQACVWTRKMARRSFLFGRGKCTSLSNRPGRRRAGSTASGVLVAPMTMTWPRSWRPSMRTSRVDTTLV